MDWLFLPKGRKDNGGLSTVLYTVTNAIAIALLTYVINDLDNKTFPLYGWMQITAALLLLTSSLLLFRAIDTLADVITFRNFYPNDLVKIKRLYKYTLISYNLSEIFIITSVMLLVCRYILIKWIGGEFVHIVFLLVWLATILKLLNDVFLVWRSDVVDKYDENEN